MVRVGFGCVSLPQGCLPATGMLARARKFWLLIAPHTCGRAPLLVGRLPLGFGWDSSRRLDFGRLRVVRLSFGWGSGRRLVSGGVRVGFGWGSVRLLGSGGFGWSSEGVWFRVEFGWGSGGIRVGSWFRVVRVEVG